MSTITYLPMSYTELTDWLLAIAEEFGLVGEAALPMLNCGPYIPDEPDKLVTITVTSGIGLGNEGATDSPTFQVRCRGDQSDQASGEGIAFTIDGLLMSQLFPQLMPSGRMINLVDRVGGIPSTLGPPDDAYRFDYICNYRVVIGAQSG